MNKKIFIILSCICIIIIIILFISNSKEYISIEHNKETFEKYINFYRLNLERIDIHINNRLILKNENEIIIGKSKNELENGYYDVRIVIRESFIEIYVNKLFKEFDSNSTYDAVYVNDIVGVVTDAFNLNKLKSYLEGIIIENYKIIRDNKRQDAYNLDKMLNIEETVINITVHKNILVLKIGDIK